MNIPLIISSCIVMSVSALADTAQPNIIFMLSDDQHWNESSVQMHPDIAESKNTNYPTPYLEKLAAEGMRFSAAYAPAPVCSATRASIQTGLSPATLKWCKASPVVTASKGNFRLLPPTSRRSLDQEVTFASYLQEAGYNTAHYGKWHIGGGGPANKGYHHSDGDIGNEASGKFKDDNPVDIVGMTNRATAFIDTSIKENKPFFIQMSYLALHSPENASKKNITKLSGIHPTLSTRNIQRMALTADLDEGVGSLIAHLDKLKITNNTYIIYMSDNGANGDNKKVIKGNKGSLHEGGIRAIFIVKGPGVPQNTWSHQRVVGFDLFPTFCKLANVSKTLPENIEGVDISTLFHGSKETLKRKHDSLLFHFPHYQSAAPMSALYSDHYKLVRNYENQTDRLYNIDQDLAEETDISTKDPETLKRIQALLERQLLATNAALPTANPDFDPSQPAVTISRGKKGGRKGMRDGGKGRRSLRQ